MSASKSPYASGRQSVPLDSRTSTVVTSGRIAKTGVDLTPVPLPPLPFREGDRTIEYWLVVKAANRSLYDALRKVLGSRQNFYVIVDRRSGDGAPPPSGERRRSQVWQGDEMLVAERQIPADDAAS